MDISREVSPFVKRIYQAVRKEDDNLPGVKFLKSIIRSLAPENLTQVADIDSSSPVEGGPKVRGNQVFLKDGIVLHGVDTVLLCTGYLYVYPFLKSFYKDVKTTNRPSSKTDEIGAGILVTDGNQVHNLYKDIFYIHDPTLAFVGLHVNIAIFAFFDIQAMTVAAVFSSKAFLPTLSEMELEYEARKAGGGEVGEAFMSWGPF